MRAFGRSGVVGCVAISQLRELSEAPTRSSDWSQLPANLIGNDQITCGNVYSTLWHVTVFDENDPSAGDADYLTLWKLSEQYPWSSNAWKRTQAP